MTHSHKAVPPLKVFSHDPCSFKHRKTNTFITLDSTTVFVLRHLFYQKESETGALISPFSLKYGLNYLTKINLLIFSKVFLCIYKFESAQFSSSRVTYFQN